MSLTTKIHGFTGWVNLRLAPKGYVLHNVLTDLLKGRHMKHLLESLTGKPSKKIDSFDGLTLTQKQTRVDWMVDELMRMELVKGFVSFDSRMFAMRSANSVFDLLWCLVCHDIWFVWERAIFLQQDDEEKLVSYPFTWIPPEPPKKPQPVKQDVSLLAGFGANAVKQEPVDNKQSAAKWTSRAALIERDEEMIQVPKGNRGELYPSPDTCILQLVHAHLKMTKEGQKLLRGPMGLDDLGDSRVLCALVNSLVPGSFTAEVLLNDRWTVNLVLTTINEMFRTTNPFTAEDFVEADVTSICSYFTYFFMCGYRYKQAKAVIHRKEILMNQKFRATEHLEGMMGSQHEWTKTTFERKNFLETDIQRCNSELITLDARYDTEDFAEWVRHVAAIQAKVRDIVSKKLKEMYEIITVPGNLTINDLVAGMMINLTLTSGVGFYEGKTKETFTRDRKLVARHIDTGAFYDDGMKPGKPRCFVRDMLGVPKADLVDVQPSDYPAYELFFESTSRNKVLKAGSRFLYKVFPGNNTACQKMLLKAATSGDLDVVQKLVNFFHTDKSFVNCKENGTRNSPLHLACRQGHFNIALFLLENHANVDCENTLGMTPIFLAVEGVHRNVALLLVEWNADIYHRNRHGRTALDLMKHMDIRDTLIDKSEIVNSLTKSVMAGDFSMLRDEILEHCNGEKRFVSFRSRSIKGSTVLHTASYFGEHDIMKALLSEGVDANVKDYVGATPIHRAKDTSAVEILLAAGADVNAVDQDNNNALHLKCYGEQEQPIDSDLLLKLIEKKVPVTARNKRGLMPVHCCAMQGNIDVLKFFLQGETADVIKDALLNEDKLPPSLPHLAIANNHLECAKWLLEHDFIFKAEEANVLLEKILMEQIPCDNHRDTVSFLISADASPNLVYPGGNTALHLAASQNTMTDVVQLLLENGADVNAVNGNRCSALFFAAKSDNMCGASILIRHGADLKLRNYQGLTAFDLISDLDGWIESGYFNDESVLRLKAYNLKEARNLIRSITRRVRGLSVVPSSHHNRTTANPHQRSTSVPAMLPPIER